MFNIWMILIITTYCHIYDQINKNVKNTTLLNSMVIIQVIELRYKDVKYAYPKASAYYQIICK